MKKILFVLLGCASISGFSQSKNPTDDFFNNLKKHCDKAYKGEITQGQGNKDFDGKELVMHVRSCKENEIRIPFFVGDDKSRTWVLKRENDRILLKHDHRHQDGSEDKVTQYGGWTPNAGSSSMQIFPADEETRVLIPYAANNVWWITIDETSFTYNLRRVGSDRQFSVKFDLSKEVKKPQAPWGWKD